MSSAMQKLSAAAETTGLSFDRERNILYGTFGNYAFAVLVNASNVRYCSILFHVTRDGNPFTANDGKEIAKESNKLLQFAKPSGAAPASFLVKLEKDEQGTAQRVLERRTSRAPHSGSWTLSTSFPPPSPTAATSTPARAAARKWRRSPAPWGTAFAFCARIASNPFQPV